MFCTLVYSIFVDLAFVGENVLYVCCIQYKTICIINKRDSNLDFEMFLEFEIDMYVLFVCLILQATTIIPVAARVVNSCCF